MLLSRPNALIPNTGLNNSITCIKNMFNILCICYIVIYIVLCFTFCYAVGINLGNLNLDSDRAQVIPS